MATGSIEEVAERVWEVVEDSCLNPFYGNAAAVETLAQMIRQRPDSANDPSQRPEGIGKATLVRRFAAELLGDRDKIEQDDLSLPRMSRPDRRTGEIAGRQAFRRSRCCSPRTWTSSHSRPMDRCGRSPSSRCGLLKERAQFGPLRGSYRVFLIDHIDRANEQAANSLLKILEEPPPYLILLMTAENAYDLLPTIRSRSLILAHVAAVRGRNGRFHARPGAEGFRSVAWRLQVAVRESRCRLDLDAYDKRRAAMIALLQAASGVQPFCGVGQGVGIAGPDR